MKNKFLTIILLAISISTCKAQIIPIEEHRNYKEDEIEIPDGAYLKDVNGILNKFVGTWKGLYGSKGYEFKIEKNTKSFLGIKKDELLMRYKITGVNGNIIENTLSLPNDSPYVLKNGYVDESKGYDFYYIGENVKCGQNGVVFTQVYGVNNNKLQLFLSVEGEMYPSCYSGPAEQIFPLKSMKLTRQ